MIESKGKIVFELKERDTLIKESIEELKKILYSIKKHF